MKGKSLKIDQEKKVQLSQYIEGWLRERGLLDSNQVIEISLRVLPASAAVVINDADEAKSLKHVVSLISRNMRVRMEGAIKHHNISHLDELLCLNVSTIIRWRNIGKLAILALGDALEKAGFSESLLAQDIKRYYTRDKIALKDEACRSEVLPVGDSDWDSMISSLQKVEREHTKTQVKVVTALKQSGNLPAIASELFPKKIHPSFWKAFISIINVRWSGTGLPYRMKFTPAPTTKCKWEGKIQIGFYEEKN